MEIDDFKGLLGQTFTIDFEENRVEAELNEVKELGKDENTGFSLLFETKGESTIYAQKMYQLYWPEGEKSSFIFLVPVRSGETGTSYEAIFN
ncbi:MAG: hypothetical protein NXI00_16285 [Cytophagales bacterium]|nr:hypothetical protein [Cytophagales bacterium]